MAKYVLEIISKDKSLKENYARKSISGFIRHTNLHLQSTTCQNSYMIEFECQVATFVRYKTALLAFGTTLPKHKMMLSGHSLKVTNMYSTQYAVQIKGIDASNQHRL